jgi:RimJ/RimL family protein N-acetyltransferase
MMVYDRQEYIKSWVSSHIGGIDLGLGAGIGIAKNGEIVAAVYYNNFRVSPKKQPISIEANVVVIDRTAINRHNLREFFEYPFIRLGVKRVGATVAKRNKIARRLLQRLGFKYEGVARKAWHFGEDCAVYSLLKPECKWI